MKRAIIFLAPLVFLALTACGGKKDKKPPEPAGSKNDPNFQQGLKDLQSAAEQMKQACTKSLTPMFIPIAAMLSQQNQQGSASSSSSNSGLSGMFNGPMGPMLAQMIVQKMTAPPSNDCKNAMMNTLMAFKTLQYKDEKGNLKQYAADPKAQEWMKQQIASVADNVGGGIQSSGTALTPLLISQLLGVGMEYGNKQLIPSLGSMAGPVSAALAASGSGGDSMLPIMMMAMNSQNNSANQTAVTAPPVPTGAVGASSSSSLLSGIAAAGSKLPVTTSNGLNPNYGGFIPFY